MATTKRLTRHEIKEPDPFLETLERAIRYTREHRTGLVGGAIALVVLGVVTFTAVRWISERDARAGAALSEALRQNSRPVGGEGAVAGEEPFATQADKDSAVLAAANLVLDQHGSSRSARGALILKARLLAHGGQYREAADLFSRVVGGSTPTDALGAAAFLAAASMRAASGDVTSALSELERIAGSGNPYLPSARAVERAAEVARSAGQKREALAIYRRLLGETDDAAVKSRVEREVEQLERELETAAVDAGASTEAEP